MKILHTADWHIGQLFHEYDRTYEHQKFLNWLVDKIRDEAIDVLLVSGDVFDNSNPSAASIRMFYTFLNNATKIQPRLQIIITAGNHDSPSRLEAPKPLLESSNIHIVGTIERHSDGGFNIEKLIVPIHDSAGNDVVWCLAIPFLRMGDYPVIHGSTNPYPDGVGALYEEAYQLALSKKKDNHVIIAMGHIHTLDAETTDHDKSERLIMGGVEFVPASVFNQNFAYTALGHIHKAQRIGGRENVRYSGSPLPMSFSEINYKHQVIVFDIDTDGGVASNIHPLEIPLAMQLLRVPATPKPLEEVLSEIQNLPEAIETEEQAPYLEVRALLYSPEPSLRHKIQNALLGKYAKLAKIDVRYPPKETEEESEGVITYNQLQKLKPISIFNRIYKSRFNSNVPEELVALFNEVVNSVGQP